LATDDLTPRPAETRTRAVGVIAVAFICGILIGVAADHAYLLHARRLMPSHFPGRVPRMFVDHITRTLDLTPEQRKTVEQILERRRARVASIWTNVRPQITREIEETNAEIEKILTPEQREKFAKVKMRMGPGHPRFGRE